MYTEIKKKLLISRINDKVVNFDTNIDLIEKLLDYKFPENYAALLMEMEKSIVFDNGAKYRPLVQSPVDTKQGTQYLDILYGIVGDYNLIEQFKMYRNQLPSSYFPIGESSGGNLICVEKNSGEVYFWYHEALYENEMLFKIAESIDEFISSLEKDDEEVSLLGVIESESFLNF